MPSAMKHWHKLLLQLDMLLNAIPPHFLTVCLSMFPYWANCRRMYEAEAGGKLQKTYTLMLQSNRAVLLSQVKTRFTQTQWPKTGPADHQMIVTLPDYRRDPPELETDMPDANLETKADNTCICPRFCFYHPKTNCWGKELLQNRRLMTLNLFFLKVCHIF